MASLWLAPKQPMHAKNFRFLPSPRIVTAPPKPPWMGSSEDFSEAPSPRPIRLPRIETRIFLSVEVHHKGEDMGMEMKPDGEKQTFGRAPIPCKYVRGTGGLGGDTGTSQSKPLSVLRTVLVRERYLNPLPPREEGDGGQAGHPGQVLCLNIVAGEDYNGNVLEGCWNPPGSR